MYVQGCKKCQRSKPDRTKQWAPLHPHNILPHPWHTISWDIIGLIPKSNTYNCILIICDKLTKMTLLELVNTTLTAQGTARILWDQVMRNYGIPCKIISDRGLQFISKFMQEFLKSRETQALPTIHRLMARPSAWAKKLKYTYTHTSPSCKMTGPNGSQLLNLPWTIDNILLLSNHPSF